MSTRWLYPFLQQHRGDVDAFADVEALARDAERSSEAKAHEIGGLRERVILELGPSLEACAQVMALAFGRGATLFTFGNGGSATDAQALAALLSAPPRGRPLRALALPDDVATLTALANDVGFDVVFSRQLAALGRRGDLAAGFSTSGNSQNVIAALTEARRLGLTTIAFAGYAGGAMAACDAIEHLFVVPSSSVHRIQEAQTTLYHVLWELVQAAEVGIEAP
jgi:D-sedoheptulose 7-phosphate isomerase